MKLLNNVTWREIPSIRLSGSSHGKVFLLLEKYLGMNASLWSSAVCVVLNFRYFFWVFLWCLCLNYKWQHWLWVLPGAILLSYQSFDVKCWLLSFDACVCVCVCLRPSAVKASSVWNSWDSQGTDQPCCVEDVGFLRRFPSSLLWNEDHNLSASRFILFVH